MIPRLVVLTDRAQLPLGRALVRTVAECADAGLGAVIVREHDLPTTARTALIQQLAAIPGLLVVTSRVPDPNAHALHVSADQQAPRHGRWGKSCHGRSDVQCATEQGADWVTLSPYATSRSKPGYGPALPPTVFTGHAIPVLALSGVDTTNAARAFAAGAYGVAVMGAVMRAKEPAAVVAELLRVLL